MILPDSGTASGTAFSSESRQRNLEISVPLLRVYSIRGNALLTAAFPLTSFPHCANDIFPRHIVTVHSPLPQVGEGLGVRVVDSKTYPLTLALSPIPSPP